VYAHGDCDVVVDTTNAGPDECAAVIVDAIGALAPPKAFDRLRRR
jgi:chloramphenicol 3-O phosphotransferase